MNRQSMWKRVVMRVLQENGQNLHPGRLGLAGSVGHGPLQSPGAVGRVLPSLSSEKEGIKASVMISAHCAVKRYSKAPSALGSVTGPGCCILH